MFTSPSSYTKSSNESFDSTSKFKSISENLDRQIVSYRGARERAESEPDNKSYQDEFLAAAENVASAMKEAADAHPDPATGRKWRRKADSFTRLSRDEGDHAMRDIGKGLLAIIITPFALAGLGVYAAGVIVTGLGSVLKGIGSFGKAALIKRRRGDF